MLFYIRRMWKEYGNPALKCARVGHRPRKRTETGPMVGGDEILSITPRYYETVEYCSRCDPGRERPLSRYRWGVYSG